MSPRLSSMKIVVRFLFIISTPTIATFHHDTDASYLEGVRIRENDRLYQNGRSRGSHSADPTARARVHFCSESKATIGFGHRLTAEELETGEIVVPSLLPGGAEVSRPFRPDGISYEEAEALFQRDWGVCQDRVKNLKPGWRDGRHPALVKNVLTEMVFQMGFRGVCGFKKMLAVLESGNYGEAAREMLDSRWARQTPRRAQALAAMVRQSSDASASKGRGRGSASHTAHRTSGGNHNHRGYHQHQQHHRGRGSGPSHRSGSSSSTTTLSRGVNPLAAGVGDLLLSTVNGFLGDGNVRTGSGGGDHSRVGGGGMSVSLRLGGRGRG